MYKIKDHERRTFHRAVVICNDCNVRMLPSSYVYIVSVKQWETLYQCPTKGCYNCWLMMHFRAQEAFRKPKRV